MILFRVDANEYIGIGHVMRCLSVARAFVDKGEKILFLTADHRGDSLIKQQGFETVCLDSVYSDMEGENVRQFVIDSRPDLLLIDSYYITERYLNSLRDLVHIVYFDDLNTKCWDIDYLINYNIYADVLDYSWYNLKNTVLLLNPQYVPLRNEFCKCPKHMNKEVSDILVSSGGADPEYITERIMACICHEKMEMVFHFVVGALNPRLDIIRALAEGKDNIVLHINERHMSELMRKCDIAISAAGTTLYELCATGTPTIMYTLADNQLAAAEQFEKQKIMLSAGDCRSDEYFMKRIENQLDKMVGDKKLREGLSTKMQNLVDGEGAKRIAEVLLEHLMLLKR